MLTMWLESCYGCIPAFSRDMPRLLSSGRDFVYLHIVRRVSRLMKIPQERGNTLGVLLKTNRFISPLILTRGLEWSIEMRKIKTFTTYVDSEYCKRY